MELVLIIYFIDVFTTISPDILLIPMFGGLAVTFLVFMAKTDGGNEIYYYEDGEKKLKADVIGIIRKYVVINVICIIFIGLLPSKEGAYSMLAAYGVQTVAQNERVQELAGQSLDLLENYMRKYNEEFTVKGE